MPLPQKFVHLPVGVMFWRHCQQPLQLPLPMVQTEARPLGWSMQKLAQAGSLGGFMFWQGEQPPQFFQCQPHAPAQPLRTPVQKALHGRPWVVMCTRQGGHPLQSPLGIAQALSQPFAWWKQKLAHFPTLAGVTDWHSQQAPQLSLCQPQAPGQPLGHIAHCVRQCSVIAVVDKVVVVVVVCDEEVEHHVSAMKERYKAKLSAFLSSSQNHGQSTRTPSWLKTIQPPPRPTLAQYSLVPTAT
mmetsp:Transcript_89534/g.253665  ORF Transcript_89534/g.253665 Transcript_89534/m.253665 type:complete len:242 (+) Transcript_89534:1073-1798(+)